MVGGSEFTHQLHFRSEPTLDQPKAVWGLGGRGAQAALLGSRSPSVPQHSPCHPKSPGPDCEPEGTKPHFRDSSFLRRWQAGGGGRGRLSLWGRFGTPQPPPLASTSPPPHLTPL